LSAGHALRTSNTTGNNNTALGTGAGLSLTTADNIIDTRNGGVTGDAGAIRFGKARNSERQILLPVSVGLLSGSDGSLNRQPARLSRARAA